MLKKRLIPTLLYRENVLVKGKQFISKRKIGSIIESVKVYNLREVDELILLDVDKGSDEPDLNIISEAATECFVTNRRHLNPSVILAALMLAHFYGENIKKLRRFSEVLLSGVSESPDEKVIILAREAFMRNTNNGESDKIEKLLKTQKAIHAYCRGENVTRLYLPKEASYPYEELFNV